MENWTVVHGVAVNGELSQKPRLDAGEVIVVD